jgi:hypothetical protein
MHIKLFLAACDLISAQKVLYSIELSEAFAGQPVVYL